MRSVANLRGAPIFLATALLVSAPAFANQPGEQEFDRASELHHESRYREAAVRWMVAYAEGYREEVSAYNAACALARAGKVDAAFHWLGRAAEAGFDLGNYLDDDDDLASLRGDPRFTALQQQVLGGRKSEKMREAEHLAKKFYAMQASGDVESENLDSLGRELLRAGRYEEAAVALEKAAADDESPSTQLYNAACARSLQGRQEQALDLLERAVGAGFTSVEHMDKDDDLDNIRNHPRFQRIRAMAAELDTPPYPSQASDRDTRSRRQWEAALPRIAAATVRYPQLGLAWFNRGFAHFALGEPEQAVRPFEKAVELGYRRIDSMYNVACAHALSNHPDQAFVWLDRAVAAGFDNWWSITKDEDLDPLRGDPRFQKYLNLARSHHDDW